MSCYVLNSVIDDIANAWKITITKNTNFMDLWWSRPGQIVTLAIRDQEPGGFQTKDTGEKFI